MKQKHENGFIGNFLTKIIISYLKLTIIFIIIHSSSTLYSQTVDVTVYNDFGGGDVRIAAKTYPQGTTVPVRIGVFTVSAIDRQYYDGYYRVFRQWNNDVSQNSISKTQFFDAKISFTANFLKECNLTFRNYYSGVDSGGIIKVGVEDFSSPASGFTCLETKALNAEASQPDTVMNGIKYSFNHWENGSTAMKRIIQPTEHTTYTAYFTGKPLPVKITVTGTETSSIKLNWEGYPNSNIKYKVVRIIEKDLEIGEPEILTTLNNNINCWIDNEYLLYPKTDYYVANYAISAYYTLEGTTSEPVFIRIPVKPNPEKIKLVTRVQNLLKEDNLSCFSVQNYPNPCNPSTTFSIKVPNSEHVLLKVYDRLGKEVSTLVDQVLSQGTHNILFNGNNFSTGIYMYKMTAGSYIKLGKIILLK